MGSIAGKLTVVTGASSGIGRAIAKKFAAEGSRVVLMARRADRLEEAVREIALDGGNAEYAVADVADRAQVDAAIDGIAQKHGKLDILVNSAGFGLLKRFADTAPADIDAQIAANVTGLCNITHAALRHMLPAKSGQMINLGSIASLKPCAGLAMYTLVKHAVYGFSLAIYEEYRTQGIRVSVLCPASVVTDFYDVAGFAALPYPAREQIQPADVAEAAYYCATAPDNVTVETIRMWPVCQDTLYR